MEGGASGRLAARVGGKDEGWECGLPQLGGGGVNNGVLGLYTAFHPLPYVESNIQYQYFLSVYIEEFFLR